MVRTKVHEMAIQGEDEDLEEFLADPENKKLVNEPDAVGWTPLHWACSKGHNQVVRMLLANAADPNLATEADGWTAAHDAARRGNQDALRQIQQAGGNIERASSSGTRPLHYAVQYGQSKAVQWMLQEGCDVDGANVTGWSPLHFSARYGRKDICEMLLAQVWPRPTPVCGHAFPPAPRGSAAPAPRSLRLTAALSVSPCFPPSLPHPLPPPPLPLPRVAVGRLSDARGQNWAQLPGSGRLGEAEH